MSLASRLYNLQQADTQLRDAQRHLDEVVRRLDHNEQLDRAEAAVAAQDTALDAARKTQRTLEYEVDDLTAKIKETSNRLYGGAVRNPKELMGLEQDFQSLRRRREKQEELLLEAMGNTEGLESSTRELHTDLERLRAEWEAESASLRAEREVTRTEIDRLRQLRAGMRQEMGAETANLYDGLVQTRGVAVVKVEGGRCKGCNLTVPTGQWQRARSGDVVQCPSCSRIIYVD